MTELDATIGDSDVLWDLIGVKVAIGPRHEATLRITDGRLLDCEILDLPFYDAEKHIPRRLEKAKP